MNIVEINEAIKQVDTNQISDGYHTFGELYEHRITIYIALCAIAATELGNEVWISKAHSDGSIWDGWFILGINKAKGEQITYHLPIEKWDKCESFAEVLETAPEYDGHSSNDVLNRLQNI